MSDESFVTDHDLKTIDSLLRINEANIQHELASVASYYFHYSNLAVEAELYAEKLELTLSTVETKVARAVKSGNTKGEAKEADIKRACREDEEWLAEQDKLLNMQRSAKILSKIAIAFDMKSKMLMSLNRRDLHKTENHL